MEKQPPPHPDGLTRRELLVRGAKAGLVTAFSLGGGYLLTTGNSTPPPPALAGPARIPETKVTGAPLAVVTGRPPAEITRRAVDLLGGMGKFVGRGDVVAVKPNIGWDRVPDQGANTHPEIVATVVMMAFEAGAKKVVVADVPCNQARRTYVRSGIGPAAEAAGAQVLYPDEVLLKEMDLKGQVLRQWPVLAPLVEVDRFINLPILKHHSLTGLTIGMKNLMGILSGRRHRLHQRIDDALVDLTAFVKPTLTILDATRVLLRSGPQGGRLEDVDRLDTVVATADPIAADAYGAVLFGAEAPQFDFIIKGEEAGLGAASLPANRILRESL